MLSHRKRKPLASRTGSILPEQEPIYSQSYIPQPEIDNINEGDWVRHKFMDYLNAGLPIQVLDTDRYQALCSYLNDLTKAPIITWYDKADLTLVNSQEES